ncbi:hypothetical protein BCR34DRAFT_607980 [Clohesyomyces aquaticus]|uniref:Uncharacterized protein n=1 Tax=Clohesyomyces aquaticus TaxID=1231657 RepID=A0A1Y1YBG7_9PLEO|nr:hypothetical protein BCR34DRAFT_607980 [Clohesyomyces aquaticus]
MPLEDGLAVELPLWFVPDDPEETTLDVALVVDELVRLEEPELEEPKVVLEGNRLAVVLAVDRVEELVVLEDPEVIGGEDILVEAELMGRLRDPEVAVEREFEELVRVIVERDETPVGKPVKRLDIGTVERNSGVLGLVVLGVSPRPEERLALDWLRVVPVKEAKDPDKIPEELIGILGDVEGPEPIPLSDIEVV